MNYISIAVSTVTPVVIGFTYYHPKVLGGLWMKANNFSADFMTKGPKPALYLISLVASFFLSMFFMGWVTGNGGADQGQVIDAIDGHSYVTFKHGVFHGFVFTITVLFPIFCTMAIFERRKLSWALVNMGYWAITAMVMCGVLSAWR